jgi:hypothetical protein
VNLIRNGSVRSWTVDQDVDGVSMVGGHRLVICDLKRELFSKEWSPFLPLGCWAARGIQKMGSPEVRGKSNFHPPPAFAATISVRNQSPGLECMMPPSAKMVVAVR